MSYFGDGISPIFGTPGSDYHAITLKGSFASGAIPEIVLSIDGNERWDFGYDAGGHDFAIHHVYTPDVSKNKDVVYITDAIVPLVGISQVAPGAQLHASAGSAGTVGLIAQGATGQTAAIFVAENSLGASLFTIDNDGTTRLQSAVVLTDAKNITLGSSTGNKIGTATSEKLGFFNAAPVAQQGATVSLETALSNLGLRAVGTSAPLSIAALSCTTIAATGDYSRTGQGTGQSKLTFGGTNATAVISYSDGGSQFVGIGDTNSNNRFTVGVGNGNVTTTGDIVVAAGKNLILATATGTKIGTATNQLLGFWNASPVAQHSSTGQTAGFTQVGALGAVDDDSTFTGGVGSTAYTIGDVVRALKNCGIMTQ